MPASDVTALLEAYPRIYFACHRRHVRDPGSGRVLSANQASILDHLDRVDPTSLSALAGHMGVTPSTMSLAVDRLVRQRYVVRTRDPRDGRRVHLRLTDAGARIRMSSSVLDPDRVETLLRQLSPADRAAGIRGIEILARAADAAMQQSRERRRRSPAASLSSRRSP